MLVEVKVPVFSESVTEGTLLNWQKKVGERVERRLVIGVVPARSAVQREHHWPFDHLGTFRHQSGAVDIEPDLGPSNTSLQRFLLVER